MQHANVKLSKNELALVSDMQVILTKNRIIEKVYTLFGMLADDFQRLLTERRDDLPAEVLSVSPKISKGEQYEELPYVVLDCPRFYTRHHILAVRCFFWWGNFFSITLHLAGHFLEDREERLLGWMEAHGNNGWYICVNTNAWQHHFETNNYRSIDELAGEKTLDIALRNRNFIKLAKKIPLQEWDNAIEFFETAFKELLPLLEN